MSPAEADDVLMTSCACLCRPQAQKLEVLRQKKLEYLEYQRQLHLQRMQEQEMEMRMRLEHERSMVQQRTMQYNVSNARSTT